MPMNIVMAITAIATSVAEALRLSGGRKAGTPFETASTPVIAVQPLENAVRSVNVVSMPVALSEASAAGSTGWSEPVAYRHAPTAIIARMLMMKKYVGAAKSRADSRTPRRLPTMRITTNASAISIRLRCRAGQADVIAATPAAMLTDTVST